MSHKKGKNDFLDKSTSGRQGIKNIDINDRRKFEEWNQKEKMKLNNIKLRKMMRETIRRQKRKEIMIEKRKKKQTIKAQSVLNQRKERIQNAYYKYLRKTPVKKRSAKKISYRSINKKKKKYTSQRFRTTIVKNNENELNKTFEDIEKQL